MTYSHRLNRNGDTTLTAVSCDAWHGLVFWIEINEASWFRAIINWSMRTLDRNLGKVGYS
jgi:hypothetical protein